MTGIVTRLEDYLHHGNSLENKLTESGFKTAHPLNCKGDAVEHDQPTGFHMGFFICGQSYIDTFLELSENEAEAKAYIQKTLDWLNDKIAEVENQTHVPHLVPLKHLGIKQ